MLEMINVMTSEHLTWPDAFVLVGVVFGMAFIVWAGNR